MEKKLFDKIPYRWILIFLWACLIVGLLIAGGLFKYVADTKMPDTEALENPEFEESSIVYADDLVEIDRYFRKNRQWVRYEDLSPNLVNALIATEDHRYHRHSGIDARGLLRAMAFLGSRGGASTITQQLAKQFFTDRPSNSTIKRIWQKMKEWVIAIEFERRYTKEEIIAMFLNKFEFVNQAYGVGSAAKIYFGKDQKELTIQEAAVLVGMLKNPIIYNPASRPEASLRRRNTVLAQMYRNGYIDEEMYASYRQEDIDMSAFHQGSTFNGIAPYFMAELKKHIKNLIVKEGLVKPGDIPFNLDTDGLEIYTTIDSRYQQHAEAAMIKHMKAQQKTFNRVWQGKDPWTYISPKEQKEWSEQEKEKKLKSRSAHLHRELLKTPLYRKLRFKYLNAIIVEITSLVPEARLWEGDIQRLIKAQKDPNYLSNLVDKAYISKKQKETYHKILKLPQYNALIQQYDQVNKDLQKEARRPHRMKLYSYDGEIEKTLSTIDSIKYMNMFLQFGSVSIEPQTGYVRAWVGGTDFNIWKYDHVTSNRQVGSTFKPFLYTAALNYGILPCQKVRDMQYIIPAGDPHFKLKDLWMPSNSHDTFSDEEITLIEALKKSLNSVSVWLIKQLESVQPVIDIAEAMGITKGKIPAYPAIVLGAPQLSVLEMTAAYSTFANNGMSSKPIVIKKIVHEGVVIYESSIEQSRAIKESVNYAMVEMLKYATSNRSYALNTEFGGKTGTTNDHVDGWFMGITPNLVTGTWVGGDQYWIRFLSLNQGQGAQMARPYFIDFMQRLEHDPKIAFDTKALFRRPIGSQIIVDCSSYESLYPKEEALSDEFVDELEDIEGQQ